MVQLPIYKTVGATELLDFPLFGLLDVKAKIDTGADTGALHCTQIRQIKQDGRSVLHFSPFDHPDMEFSTENFIVKNVRSSNGMSQERYFIRTQVVILGKTYDIELSLADRSEMTWPVLIGRKFLARNRFLVDVRKQI